MATKAAQPTRMLSTPEMMALNPTSRDRYVRELVLQTVTEDKDWTITDIARKSGLSRNTVMKHLIQLSAEQRIVYEEKNLGAFRVRAYRKAGDIQNKVDAKGKYSGKLNYVFFTVDTDDKKSVIVQQREKDDFGIENVKGAIAISFDDFDIFLKEFHAFGAKIINR
jgi:hypothetical protein